jgi:hypothetical protein
MEEKDLTKYCVSQLALRNTFENSSLDVLLKRIYEYNYHSSRHCPSSCPVLKKQISGTVFSPHLQVEREQLGPSDRASITPLCCGMWRASYKSLLRRVSHTVLVKVFTIHCSAVSIKATVYKIIPNIKMIICVTFKNTFTCLSLFPFQNSKLFILKF